MNHFQLLVDGLNAKSQRERAETQITLGKLIVVLEAMQYGARVVNLYAPHSYRGHYSDLAFKRIDGTRPAYALLTDCRSAMGKVFEGYKGGDFVMGELTPLWVADYGNIGQKLMAMNADGTIETAEDEMG